MEEEEKQRLCCREEIELLKCRSEALLEQHITQLKVLGSRVIYFIAILSHLQSKKNVF